MAHHHEQQEETTNYNSLYYLVGLLTGLFIGVVIDLGITWTLSLGVVGLLFAAFFLSVFVRGREQR
ncbi:MAG: hypothetical protein JWP37_2778 [Mucilaginibacter sp.]|nr:hypothetical protein [Mucilaginibacter sp.]